MMLCAIVDVEGLAGSSLGIVGWCLELHPNVRKVMLTSIPIESRVVYPHEHGFFYCYSTALSSLPTMLKLSSVVGWPVMEW